jgi:hypothetical protein
MQGGWTGCGSLPRPHVLLLAHPREPDSHRVALDDDDARDAHAHAHAGVLHVGGGGVGGGHRDVSSAAGQMKPLPMTDSSRHVQCWACQALEV